MAASHESYVDVSDGTDAKIDRTKGRTQSIVESVNNGEVCSDGYTQEENRLLVRKLDWHVSPHAFPI